MATVKEQNLEKIMEIEGKLPEKIETYNKTLLEKGANECSSLGEEISKLSNELIKCYKVVAFEELLTEENPIISAITRLTVPIKRAKLGKAENSIVRVFSIVDANLKIDLKELEAYSKRQLMADKDWVHLIAKFNYLLLTYSVDTLMKDEKIKEGELSKIRDNYHMKEIARQKDLGKTPTSDTQILAQLNKVIASIIGKETKINNKYIKAASQDVRWLKMVYAKKDNKEVLTAVQSTDNQLRGLITEILHGIICNKEYRITSKYVKEK